MSNTDYLSQVKVIKRKDLLAAIDVDKSTLDRLEARGEGPPKTKLSKNRIGYRICDVKDWLDRRRMSSAVAATT